MRGPLQQVQGGIHGKNITELEAQRLYADLSVQTALRTVHELFEADTASVAGFFHGKKFAERIPAEKAG